MKHDQAKLLAGQRITLGIGSTLTGTYAAIGSELKHAVELAIEETNSAGGILGATIEGWALDDQGTVARGESIARDFGARSDVLGIVGHYSSDVTIAASALYQQNHLALISPIASNPALTKRGLSCIFRFTNRDDKTATAIAGYLYGKLEKRRALIIQSDYAYGKSMADCFSRAFRAMGGVIVAHERVPVGQPEFAETLQRAPKYFDMLFYGGAFEGASLLTAMRRAGVMQLFAAGDGCWDIKNFLHRAGAAAMEGEGVLVLSATPEPSTANAKAFVDRYAHRFGPPINYAMNSYESARILLRAIEQAARQKESLPRRDDVAAAVRSMEFDSIVYTDKVKWDAKGDNQAATTSLHVVRQGLFHQVAEIH